MSRETKILFAIMLIVLVPISIILRPLVWISDYYERKRLIRNFTKINEERIKLGKSPINYDIWRDGSCACYVED